MALAVEKRMGRVCEGGHIGVQIVVGELIDQGGHRPAKQHSYADPLEVLLWEPGLQSAHVRPKTFLVQLERFCWKGKLVRLSTGVEMK